MKKIKVKQLLELAKQHSQYFSGRQWLGLIVLSCSFIIITSYVLIQRPLIDRSTQLEESNLTSQKSLTAIQKYRLNDDVQAQVTNLAKQQERAEKALPKEIVSSECIGYLQQVALISKVELTQMQPGKVTKTAAGIDCLPVEVNCKADFFALLDFMKALYNGERYVQLKKLAIEAKDNKLTITMDLMLFAWNE